MIKDIVLVGIGSGIGGICRYLISLLIGQDVWWFPVGDIFSKHCWLPVDRHPMGPDKSFPEPFPGVLPATHGRFLWRFHHLLHILKRGTGDATNQ